MVLPFLGLVKSALLGTGQGKLPGDVSALVQELREVVALGCRVLGMGGRSEMLDTAPDVGQVDWPKDVRPE